MKRVNEMEDNDLEEFIDGLDRDTQCLDLRYVWNESATMIVSPNLHQIIEEWDELVLLYCCRDVLDW